MARLQQLPRVRRRRLATSFGVTIATVGSVFVVASLRNEALHPSTLVAGLVLGFGVVLLWWGRRGYAEAAAADHAELAQTGQWDSLPAGSYQQGDRIGLRALALWTWLLPTFGVLMLLVGALIAGVSEGEQEMLIGGLGVLTLGVLMFVVLFLVAGTVYWLDAQGVHRFRFPSGGVDWVDIDRIDQHKQVVILRTDGRARGLGRGKTFRISAGALEIDQTDLVRLMDTLRHHARTARR